MSVIMAPQKVINPFSSKSTHEELQLNMHYASKNALEVTKASLLIKIKSVWTPSRPRPRIPEPIFKHDSDRDPSKSGTPTALGKRMMT